MDDDKKEDSIDHEESKKSFKSSEISSQDERDQKPYNLDSLLENIDFLDLLILKQDSIILKIWHILIIFSCLTSGYFYGWLALFGLSAEDEYRTRAMYISYESIFTV